ncbi:hypothetical protein HK096_002965 [Nowakowskiella sp. JEL0078]|nr:hypothetical protein HK096_002965 [Nowakowskiella sp. JEL0078]
MPVKLISDTPPPTNRSLILITDFLLIHETITQATATTNIDSYIHTSILALAYTTSSLTPMPKCNHDGTWTRLALVHPTPHIYRPQDSQADLTTHRVLPTLTIDDGTGGVAVFSSPSHIALVTQMGSRVWEATCVTRDAMGVGVVAACAQLRIRDVDVDIGNKTPADVLVGRVEGIHMHGLVDWADIGAAIGCFEIEVVVRDARGKCVEIYLDMDGAPWCWGLVVGVVVEIGRVHLFKGRFRSLFGSLRVVGFGNVGVTTLTEFEGAEVPRRWLVNIVNEIEEVVVACALKVLELWVWSACVVCGKKVAEYHECQPIKTSDTSEPVYSGVKRELCGLMKCQISDDTYVGRITFSEFQVIQKILRLSPPEIEMLFGVVSIHWKYEPFRANFNENEEPEEELAEELDIDEHIVDLVKVGLQYEEFVDETKSMIASKCKAVGFRGIRHPFLVNCRGVRSRDWSYLKQYKMDLIGLKIEDVQEESEVVRLLKLLKNV